jgi:zinc protease
MTRAPLSVLVPICLAFAGSVAASAFQQTAAPATASQALLPPADEILRKYRTAIGGEEAIRSHTVRAVSGTFEIPAQGMRGELVVLAAAPDRMRLTITLPGLGEMQRGFDGKVGWSVDPAIGPRLLDGRELDELKHSADFYDDLHDASKYSSVTVVGKTMFEGQECYEVKLVRDSGFEYTEFFSVSTGLLAGVKMNASSQLGSVPVTTAVSEYKAFGGVLAPTITRQRMMGLESVTTITSVSYDAIDPKTFELPPAIAALAAQKK